MLKIPERQLKMKRNQTATRRIFALVFLTLALSLIFALTSCSGGSEEILSRDELYENVSADSYDGYDYVWKYLDRWNFPAFNSTKIKNAEYIVKRNLYKELPPSASLAKSCANEFLDEYYDKINLKDKNAVTDALLNCYVASLDDRWATYRTPDEYSSYNSSSSGTLIGIGITVTVGETDGGIKILNTVSGSPAEASGILAGDIIVAIDDTRVENMDFITATSLIAGEVGTKVKITVLRNGSELVFDIMRAMIDETTVSYSIEDGIGYIRISSFKLNTDEQFKAAIDYMKQNGVDSVIYDLRENLGGYLTTVFEMLEYLAPKGTTLVSFSDGTSPMVDESDESYLPYAVVLTDYNTASAAELFTAAVRDLSKMGYGKAISLGETTRGKGVMQSTFSLGDGSAITFTSAYYNAPLGENFHEMGIAPDVRVPLDGVSDTQLERATEEILKLKAAS